MGQEVPAAMPASPLKIRVKREPQGGFRAFHLPWPVTHYYLASEDQGRSVQSAIIGCLIDVLGLAQSS